MKTQSMDMTYIRITVRFSLSEKLLSYDISFRHDGSRDTVGGRKSERKREATRMAHGAHGLKFLSVGSRRSCRRQPKIAHKKEVYLGPLIEKRSLSTRPLFTLTSRVSRVRMFKWHGVNEIPCAAKRPLPALTEMGTLF